MIFWGLLFFFVLEYVRPTSYVPALLVLRLNSIIPLVNFVGALLTKGRATMRAAVAEGNTWIILFLLFLVGISVLTADVTLYAYTGFTTVLGYAMAYWVMMSELNTIERLKTMCKALVVVHLIVAALNPNVFMDPSSRQYLSSGFFLGDGNDFALSLNIVVPLCLGVILDAAKIRERLVWGGGLVILVACVVLTQSRGGTMALGGMGVYYWFKSDKKIQTGLIALVFVGLIFAYAPATYFERMNSLANTQEDSAAARIEAWKVGVRMGMDHPLLGIGVGHFGVKFGTTYLPKNLGGPWMTAHSIYFLALGELGFPGLITVLVFILWNLWANSQLSRELRDTDRYAEMRLLSSTSAALISFAIGAAFLSCLYYPHLYVLAGLMGGTRRVIRERAAVTPAATPNAGVVPITYHWTLRRPAVSHVAAGHRRR